MDWETPIAIEIKMDAEVTSYADDLSGQGEPVTEAAASAGE